VLAIELRASRPRFRAGEEVDLTAVYSNGGKTPLALAFWWNRSFRVVGADGKAVAPGPGPVLPCGVQEDWTVLAPGVRFERAEGLACTQPAGRGESIGWAYSLVPGAYRLTFVFESPAAHGFTQSRPHEHAFRGRVESNEVVVVIDEPEKKPGLFGRLLGR
jgi:hypothetical protein